MQAKLAGFEAADVIHLSQPITAHGEELRELRLRRPTVKELREAGAPYLILNVGTGSGVVPNYDACGRLIEKICNIPPSAVDQLDPADFDEACLRLMGFTKRPASAAASDAG